MLFVIQGPPEAGEYLRARDLPFVLLDEDADLHLEEEKIAVHGPFAVAFMEMLECLPPRQALLARHADKVVVFDDLLDHEYICDLVVCGQALPGYGNTFLAAEKTRFCIGLDYFLLDPVYQQHRKRLHNTDVKSALVCFGGGAYDVALLKTAYALRYHPEIEPTFVLGYANTGMGQRIADILPQARIMRGVENMSKLLSEFDLAIVSAGYLKIECAMVGVPAIMLATQWHQIPLGQEFAEISGMPYAGYMSFIELDELAESIKSFQDVKQRLKIANQAKGLVDGLGMQRVYHAVFGQEVIA
jgi:spore coat polysaccharide biosynthesis predicted glycosyltransferase SpsG